MPVQWVRRTGSARDPHGIKQITVGPPHGIKQITMFIRENVDMSAFLEEEYFITAKLLLRVTASFVAARPLSHLWRRVAIQ
ncbi:hypothetical protein J6590_037049 [Homalodisca vitripennis]|nr:hypothetical protein J6590_037049 [Homalodisca vitripennis]